MKFKRIFFVLFILVCMSCSKKENEFRIVFLEVSIDYIENFYLDISYYTD